MKAPQAAAFAEPSPTATSMASAKQQVPTRYVALLRGVNVNGITIKSADLKALFVALGFGAVRTVLASGNVLFDTDEGDAAALRTRIEHSLRNRFGYDAWIVLLTQKALAGMATGYPFERVDEERHPYLVFGSDAEMLDEIIEKAGTVDAKAERLKQGQGVLYRECPRGESTDTPVAKLLAKTRYKSNTTTRNLRTIEKLLTD